MVTAGAVSAKAVFADFPSEELQEKENSRKDRSAAETTPAKYLVRRFIKKPPVGSSKKGMVLGKHCLAAASKRAFQKQFISPDELPSKKIIHSYEEYKFPVKVLQHFYEKTFFDIERIVYNFDTVLDRR